MKIDGKKLELAMIKDGVSNLSELSEKSKISRQTISYIKNGKSCKLGTISAIAKALNCDATDILADK